MENKNDKIEENKNDKKEENLYNNIISEINELIQIYKEGDIYENLSIKCDILKGKYKEMLVKNLIPDNIENELINQFQTIYNKEKIKEKPNDNFLEFIFYLIEFLPYLYHPTEFLTDIKLQSFNEIEKQNINFLELFKSITPKENCKINILIDDLIYYLFINYKDIKSLFIEFNLLDTYPSRSVYISFKFICLYLFMFNKMTVDNINITLFNESLTYIANLFFQEASYYNQKFNNEYYNNVFEDIEFNTNDKVKRKLNNEEFKFLTNNVFKFLYLIIKTFSSHLTSFDFTEKESRIIFWNYFDKTLNNEIIDCKTELEINVYTFYILISFSLDVLSFIYSNFLYLNKEFTSKNEFHFDNYDPFFTFVETNDWKNPIFHYEFITYVKNFYLSYVNDNIKFVEIYLSLTDLKFDFNEKYDFLYEKTTNKYLIINPVESIGISSLIWIINKENKFKNINYIYSPLYILDIYLPLISSMLKTENLTKYLALETIINFSELYEKKPIIDNLNNLIYYSFYDIFDEILNYIGSQEPDEMRRYVNSKLPKIINLLDNDAKYQFFDYFCDHSLNVSEESNINDDKVAYFIQIIKNTINDNLKENKNLSFWNEDFIKKIIKNFGFNYEKIFIFEIIETVSQTLNFIIFIILKDKFNFKGKLGVYNKEYLYFIRKNINGIANLVEKFVKSSNEEKYKTLNINSLNQTEETQKAFKLKNNQCYLLLDLVNKLDNLVTKCLLELDSINNKKEN